MLFLGRNPHPTFLYFQDGLQKLLQMSSKISPCPFWDQIPAQPSSISPRSFRDLPKSCRKRQSPTRPDDSWEKAWGKLGGGCGDYSWRNGKLAKWRKLVASKSGAKGGGDYSWRKPGEARKGWRRLLLEEAWGKLAEGRGDFSWRRCRRCSETLPRPSPGDISWKLTGEKDTKLQAMKSCSFPGFFHILAKSPGVPPTVSNSRQ